MQNKPLTIRYLIKAFKEAGLPVSESWIRRQEEKGNLIIPRSTTDFKIAQGARQPGAVRYMTETQIKGILRAFLPKGIKLPDGTVAIGNGYYNYMKDNA